MPKEYGTPGPRAIYPDICTSRSVAACSVEAQLLFDRLLAQADDQGRVEGNVSILKSVCVPLVEKITTRNLNRLLGELEAEELIFRYEVGRSSLTQIPTWWRWQQGMRRAYPSRWPAPEGWTDAVYGHGDDSQATYKTWLVAAERGTAPHNAAFRGDSRHNAALTHAHASAPPAAPAVAGAVASASTGLPDSDLGEGARAVTHSVNGFSSIGDVAASLQEATDQWTTALTIEERDEWAGFGPEWAAFRDAWLRRGFRHPPKGTAEDDPDDEHPSQRAILHSVLASRPNDIVRWIDEAPKRTSATGVVGYVLRQWHEIREEAPPAWLAGARS